MLEPVVPIKQIPLEKFSFIIVFGPWQYRGGKEAQTLVCTEVRIKVVEVIDKCDVARNIHSAHLHYVNDRQTDRKSRTSFPIQFDRTEKDCTAKNEVYKAVEKQLCIHNLKKNCGGLLLCEISDRSFGLMEFKGRALGRHR
jgi:hypothetical protein